MTTHAQRAFRIRKAATILNSLEESPNQLRTRVNCQPSRAVRGPEARTTQHAALGVAAGGTLAMATQQTGVHTFAHEASHGQAMRMLFEFRDGSDGPVTQVDLFDQIAEDGFFQTLIDPRDTNGDGAAGRTQGGWGMNGLSPLGEEVGYKGSIAITAAAGSAPDLLASGLSAGLAAKAMKRGQFATGMGFLTYGVMRQMRLFFYALSPTFMSAEELQAASLKGNDFALLATTNEQLTGVSASILAPLIAIASLLVVPVIFLVSLIKGRSPQVLRDAQILAKWLDQNESNTQAENDLATWIQDYPRCQQLQQSLMRWNHRKSQNIKTLNKTRTLHLKAQLEIETARFQRYLITKIGKKTTKEITKKIALEQKKLTYTRFDACYLGLSRAKAFIYFVAPILGIMTLLGLSVAPALAICATLFIATIPILSVLGSIQSIVLAAKSIYKKLPIKLSALHVSGAVFAVLSTIALIISLAVPGGFIVWIGVSIGFGVLRFACYLAAKKLTPLSPLQQKEKKLREKLAKHTSKLARESKATFTLKDLKKNWHFLGPWNALKLTARGTYNEHIRGRGWMIASASCALIAAGLGFVGFFATGGLLYLAPIVIVFIGLSIAANQIQKKLDDIFRLEEVDLVIRCRSRSESAHAHRRNAQKSRNSMGTHTVELESKAIS